MCPTLFASLGIGASAAAAGTGAAAGAGAAAAAGTAAAAGGAAVAGTAAGLSTALNAALLASTVASGVLGIAAATKGVRGSAPVIQDTSRETRLAADAAARERRAAQGFSASILGGKNPSPPPLARQLLLGTA